jgi:hypothetical protein
VTHPLLHFSEKVINALNNDKLNISIFIDLKKAFDTVDYSILLKKLEHYGVRKNELKWFENYLTNRQQYVHLSCVGNQSNINSDKLPCKCGVPQGSCLGPLLFLFFINDLPNATQFFTLLFADDCTFQLNGSQSYDLIKRANTQLQYAQEWFNVNKLTLNVSKTKFILFKDKTSHVHLNDLVIGDNIISRVGHNCKEKYVRFLGIMIDENLSFDGHIDKLQSKLKSSIYALSTCGRAVPVSVKKLIYRCLFESHLRFGAIIYGAARPALLEPLAVLQRKAIRLVHNCKYNAHTDHLFKSSRILKCADLVQLSQVMFMREYSNNLLPTSFHNFFQYIPLEEQRCRDDNYNYKQKPLNLKMLFYSPSVQLIRSWNLADITLKAQGEISTYKSDFIASKLITYDDMCTKVSCYVCKR